VADGRGICNVTLIARLLIGISEQSLRLISMSLQTHTVAHKTLFLSTAELQEYCVCLS